MTATTTTEEQLPTVKRRSALAETWENLRHSVAGMIGLSLIVIHVFLAITSPLIVPHDPLEMNAQIRNEAPSVEHPFGTDKLGRDVFSRSLMGGRVSMLVTIVAITLAIIWGGLVGILLGFLGGRTDEIVMRIVDALLSIPWLLLLLLIIAILGTNMRVQALTFAFTYGILTIRVARAATHDFVTNEFILAARARGESKRT
ncbi:MAG: ABC transporter permease, partial [Anaerolineaceae bacterium]